MIHTRKGGICGVVLLFLLVGVVCCGVGTALAQEQGSGHCEVCSEAGQSSASSREYRQTLELDPELEASTPVWPFLVADDETKAGILDDIAHRSPWNAKNRTQMTAAIQAIWAKYPVTITTTEYYKLRDELAPKGKYPPTIAFDYSRISADIPRPIVLISAESQTLIDIATFRLDNIHAEIKAENEAKRSKHHHKRHHATTQPTSPSLSSITASSHSPQILAWGGNSPEFVRSINVVNPTEDDIKNLGKLFGHTDMVYRAMLACGRSQEEALEVASHAMDPDGDFYGPPIIDAVLHGHDHYLNPQFNTGRAATNAQTAADAARSFVAGRPKRLEYLGRASHYLTDLSNPMHTGWEAMTITDLGNVHGVYETAIGNSWSVYRDTWHCFDPVGTEQLPAYQGQTGVRDGARILAYYTHRYLNEEFERSLRGKTWEQIAADRTLRAMTRDCLTQGYRHCVQLVKYVYQ